MMLYQMKHQLLTVKPVATMDATDQNHLLSYSALSQMNIAAERARFYVKSLHYER